MLLTFLGVPFSLAGLAILIFLPSERYLGISFMAAGILLLVAVSKYFRSFVGIPDSNLEHA